MAKKDQKMFLGVFEDEDKAERAINKLKDEGYDAKDISVIMKDREGAQRVAQSTDANVGEGAVAGATTGAVVGGLAGLLVGVGALTVPGLGALFVAGPIATALGLTGAAATTVSGATTGALAGGLIGALMGLGMPREQAEVYERRVNEGAIVVAVSSSLSEDRDIRGLLRNEGAEQVDSLKI